MSHIVWQKRKKIVKSFSPTPIPLLLLVGKLYFVILKYYLNGPCLAFIFLSCKLAVPGRMCIRLQLWDAAKAEMTHSFSLYSYNFNISSLYT